MKSHNEFMEEAIEASSLPARTKKALGPESQTKSDLKSIELRDAKSNKSEVKE